MPVYVSEVGEIPPSRAAKIVRKMRDCDHPDEEVISLLDSHGGVEVCRECGATRVARSNPVRINPKTGKWDNLQRPVWPFEEWVLPRYVRDN